MAPSTPSPAATAPSREAPNVEAPKKTFGAGVRISKVGGDVLTPKQRQGLQTLTSATPPKPPDRSRRHRRVAVTWRIPVVWIRPLLKELVYPIVVDRAAGRSYWDIDGNEYVDLTCGFGSCSWFRLPPFVTKALRKRLEWGIRSGPRTPPGRGGRQSICELTGHERAALCNTGSEAVSGAMCLARTATGTVR